MTVEAARTAAAACISCRLDYCNSLLYGLPDCANFSLYRMTDHWHATQQSYLASITRTPLASHSRARQVQSGSTRRSLRSADVSTCVVPRTFSSYGDRTFCSRGTSPVELCSSPAVTADVCLLCASVCNSGCLSAMCEE